MPDRPSARAPLRILAMDHRESLGRSLFDVAHDMPDADQIASMRRAKSLIYAGLVAARASQPTGQAGVLVDEMFGADVLRAARRDGITVCLPAERSGRESFELEYGEDFADHIDRFRPDYVKVLVRMNPADPADASHAQLDRLAALSQWLADRRYPLLYELLVPATAEQLARAGDPAGYDRDLRPELVGQVIAANQAAGVEPAIWKVEGLETADAARGVVAAARAGGRDQVDLVVLGRDAPQTRLDHWLTVAAQVDGFVGFAVGRSIWEQPLTDWRAGTIDGVAFTDQVRDNYLHYCRAYQPPEATAGR